MSERDLDGMEKNLHKMWTEWEMLRTKMRPHWSRFWRDPWSEKHHSYVNLFVEYRRASPYFTGHVDAILYPLLVIAIVALPIVAAW